MSHLKETSEQKSLAYIPPPDVTTVCVYSCARVNGKDDVIGGVHVFDDVIASFCRHVGQKIILMSNSSNDFVLSILPAQLLTRTVETPFGGMQSIPFNSLEDKDTTDLIHFLDMSESKSTRIPGVPNIVIIFLQKNCSIVCKFPSVFSRKTSFDSPENLPIHVSPNFLGSIV